MAVASPTTTSGPPGAITGIVTHALTGAPIAGATVRVDGSTLSATTSGDGRFVLSGVPSGTRTLRTSANGFITETRSVVLVTGSSVNQTISDPGPPRR